MVSTSQTERERLKREQVRVPVRMSVCRSETDRKTRRARGLGDAEMLAIDVWTIYIISEPF